MSKKDKAEDKKLVKEDVSKVKAENSNKGIEVRKKRKQKPYIHIDTFLQTAVPLYKISTVQAQGFKAKMAGRHYQRDEQVFVKELKEHLNLK